MRARWRGDEYDPSRYDDTRPDAPKWVDARPLAGVMLEPLRRQTRRHGDQTGSRRDAACPSARRLPSDPLLEGVAVELNYEVYDGYPAVRKWAVVRNGGSLWLKLDRLVIDDVHLVAADAQAAGGGDVRGAAERGGL